MRPIPKCDPRDHGLKLMKSVLMLFISAATIFGVLSTDVDNVHAERDMGLVLESHVGARPRDADYLLAPLLDELRNSGFRGSSVAGTRIHSRHSISSKELTSKQIAEARQASLDAYSAYVDARFEGAISSANKATALLMSRPATMAKQQAVREYLYHSLILASLAHSRLGNTLELEATMTEFIRSFPDKEVSNKKYGPEGQDLYRKINKRLKGLKKGELQIAAEPGSMVFVNEVFKGIGSLKVSLYPGRYRIYTQNAAQSGRVHMADVSPERQHTLVVDPVIDTALRTSGKMVGFVFNDEESRAKHEKRVALELGRALGAERIVLVGFHKFSGKDSIVASTIVVTEGESGASARVPLPPNGAPSASQLRALAAFVAGAKPASDDIQVLSLEDAPTPIEMSPTTGSVDEANRVHVTERATSSASGIRPVWRWTSWITGAVGMGAGAYLISIHDTGTCSDDVCPENYDTLGPGIGLVAGGAAVGLLGFYLWTKEGDRDAAKLSLFPTSGGLRAALSVNF